MPNPFIGQNAWQLDLASHHRDESLLDQATQTKYLTKLSLWLSTHLKRRGDRRPLLAPQWPHEVSVQITASSNGMEKKSLGDVCYS